MSELTDRERILMDLVRQLYSTLLLAPCVKRGPDETERWGDYVHFARRKPRVGDLVLATSSRGANPWLIAWYVEPLDELGGAVVREIGTGRLCNYANESFVPIVGMRPLQLFEGNRRALYVKVQRAFARGGEYVYRFGGLRFDGDEAVVTIREVFAGLGAPSLPFTVRIRWTKRTSVAAILKAMRSGGYGWRSFRPMGAAQHYLNEGIRELCA